MSNQRSLLMRNVFASIYLNICIYCLYQVLNEFTVSAVGYYIIPHALCIKTKINCYRLTRLVALFSLKLKPAQLFTKWLNCMLTHLLVRFYWLTCKKCFIKSILFQTKSLIHNLHLQSLVRFCFSIMFLHSNI